MLIIKIKTHRDYLRMSSNEVNRICINTEDITRWREDMNFMRSLRTSEMFLPREHKIHISECVFFLLYRQNYRTESKPQTLYM